jgi:hypothetical protein
MQQNKSIHDFIKYVTLNCKHECERNIKLNVKVKFTLQQDTKTQRGSRDIALLFP